MKDLDKNFFTKLVDYVKDISCPVCGSKNIVKFKQIRDDTQELEYLCHCIGCGLDGDFLGINDLLYHWSKIPARRKFEHFSDNRDEGGKIIKYRVDFDRLASDPERIKKI